MMGLKSVVEKYADKTRTRDVERFCNNALCPSCGSEGIDRGGYYKCDTDSNKCEVITFIKTSFRSQVADGVL